MRILMIHGIAQGGKDPEELRGIWIYTLQQGFAAAGLQIPASVEIDFPYYGDKLDQFTQQANLPNSNDLAVKGSGQDLEYEEFLRSSLEQIKNNADIKDNEIETEILEKGVPVEKGIQNWGWVQAIARAIDNHLTGAAEFTIETFLKDVFLYVNKPAVTKGINKIIEEKLTDEPTIVIGHSLGSAVGYKVISDNLSKMNLVKYITVGSPLGLRAISGRLGVLQNPGPKGWNNAFDERDIVALNPLDGMYFPTDPSIKNFNGVDNFTENRHGIIGYLNNPEVAKAIAEVIG